VHSAVRHCKTSAGCNEEHAVFACNEHQVIPVEDSRRGYSIEGISLQDSHLRIRTFGDAESSPHALADARLNRRSSLRGSFSAVFTRRQSVLQTELC
jgi:hypothetical protein